MPAIEGPVLLYTSENRLFLSGEENLKKTGIHAQIRITTKTQPLLEGHLLPMPSLVDVRFRVCQLSCLAYRMTERMKE